MTHRSFRSALASRALILVLTIALGPGALADFGVARAADAAPARNPRRPNAPVAAPATEPIAGTKRPEDLSNLDAWVRYKTRTRQAALPIESRLFYRRGLLAKQTGSFEEAVRLVRGSSQLDPTFAVPHLTLFRWFLIRDPGQALMHLAGLADLARQSFVFQLELAANGLYALLFAIFGALLATGLLTVVLRNQELRHPFQEAFGRFMGAKAARAWPWVLIAVPFVVGLGLSLPTVFLLGLLWPASKLRERALFVTLTLMLLAAPWVALQMDRVATPLRPDAAPFYGVVTLQNQAYSPERRQAIATLASQHAGEPILQFGLAWMARQGDDLAAAEEGYRKALTLMPGNARVMNNLANVLALQGRIDESLALYQKAIAADATNAAAYFNLAQLQNQRFDFHAATEALSKASALNFEMVKAQQAETADGYVPLVDQWIAPADFWRALLAYPGDAAHAPALPPAWRGRIEFAGMPFTVALLIAAVLGVVVGTTQQRKVPLRRCSNCETVVCRRCAERRRELALCRSCAAIEAPTKTADFARVLLTDHKRKKQKPTRMVRTILSAIVPGYGMLALHRVFTPVALLTFSVALVGMWFDAWAPFWYEARVLPLQHGLPWYLVLAPWLLIVAWSVLGYLSEQTRHDQRVVAAAKATRLRPSTNRHVTAAAA